MALRGGWFCIAWGLSETSASLNDGGCGSGSPAKVPTSCGAGFAAFGHGGSAVLVCGAVYARSRKNGSLGGVFWMKSSALAVRTSPLKSAGAEP